ncbi:hypothetical protein [Bradyrhizobium sp. USDA 3650]
MGEGFQAIVNLYVKMQNYAALEEQKLHRLQLLTQLGQISEFTAARQAIQQDIDLINLAFSNRLKTAQLRYHFDTFTHQKIVGWAYYPEFPTNRAVLTILRNDTEIATVTVNTFRSDLLVAGYGDGKCSFSLDLPADMELTQNTTLEVRTFGGTTLARRTIESGPE